MSSIGTIYRGERTEHGTIVQAIAGFRTRTLAPRRAHQGSHSPTGFEWGYLGSGPAELAHALCADLTGDAGVSPAVYQRFKERVVAKIQADVWQFTEAELGEHLTAIAAELGW